MPALPRHRTPAVPAPPANPLPGGDRLSYEGAPGATHATKETEITDGPLDTAAMEEMLSALHPAAFGWALACCNRDRTLAEEVSQMVYLKILAGEARFEGRSSFKTWLFGVIRRTAAGERRKAWLSLSRLARFARGRPDPGPAASPEAETMRAREASRLASALAALSRRQQEILHLVFYQSLTLAEAAAIMGVSVGTARIHYDRGKERLRAMLSSDPAPGASR